MVSGVMKEAFGVDREVFPPGGVGGRLWVAFVAGFLEPLPLLLTGIGLV